MNQSKLLGHLALNIIENQSRVQHQNFNSKLHRSVLNACRGHLTLQNTGQEACKVACLGDPMSAQPFDCRNKETYVEGWINLSCQSDKSTSFIRKRQRIYNINAVLASLFHWICPVGGKAWRKRGVESHQDTQRKNFFTIWPYGRHIIGQVQLEICK